MKVLLTGAFGNIGLHTLEALLARGIQVRCFDLKTRATEALARRYGDRIEIAWGDLRRPETVRAAVEDQDVVIHLAFVIPTLSATGVGCEEQPDWAREINVGGTANLIAALQAQPHPARLIFASSLHVYGPTQDLQPPRQACDPVHPVEHYAHHKIECEALVRASGLQWAILRLPATLPVRLIMDPGMFDVPLNNRIEYAHGRDVGAAFANAVDCEGVWGKTLLIGGGQPGQFYYQELVTRILDGLGVGMLPEAAFSTTPFATDWLDSAESEALLHYQRRTLEDYLQDLRLRLSWRRPLIRLFRLPVRLWLLKQSHYYQAARQNALLKRKQARQSNAA